MVAIQRLKVEQANRAVEFVLDYPDVALWASADGKSVAQWLSDFNTPFSVALTEGVLPDWGAPLPEPTPTYLLSEARFQQAKRMLALKATVRLSTPAQSPYVTVRSERGAVFYVVGEPSAIAQIGLGLDPLQTAQVQAGGKPIVARLFNPQGISPLALRGSLMQAREQGATLMIFAGDQVLGYRRGLQATAQNLQAHALRFGAIEFAKQMGAGNLMQAIPDRTVRVHSIGLAESLALSPDEMVDRLERAVQERNIRVVYLRAAGADTMLLREILLRLSERLHRSGYAIRESGARPFEPLQPALWQFALMGAGVGLLVCWLLAQWRSAGYWAAAPVVLGVACALLCLLPIGRKLVALTAALLFPTVGMFALTGASRGRGFSWLNLASLLTLPFAWSLLGALHIVGLLGETPFLIKADQFTGVKAAHALPLLFVLAFYAAYVAGRWDFWREWLARPVLWGQMTLALIILGAVGLMLIRTGNEAPGAVPDWELRLRTLLETVTNVRPRTKEFLIGHPALVVAVGLLLTRRVQWLPLAMFLGAIGQASIVNTFCHLHSPLMVSLQRTAWGALIGIAIGAVAWWALQRLGGDSPRESTLIDS
ncbi:MAG: hypothetical protein KatS3mg020_0923 [Fimbriimonadales bacterium]|nr:MAG: hypothetical protein KatS3mg020_0923 [Fimbriimonadales bacterium]